MPPKREPNVVGNIPTSRPVPSIKSIMKDFQKSLKDLQDLDKSLVTKNELEALKVKMKMLEDENANLKVELESTKKINENLQDENAKLKSDFEEAESNGKLYYNQYHQNRKEVKGLKTEIQRLENQNQALKDENEFLKESADNGSKSDQVPQLSEASSPSLAPAIPVEDSESDVDEVIENDDDPLTDEPDAKKPRLVINSDPENPWKCMVCKIVRFKTLEEVREHTKISHPERKHFCDTCPYSSHYSNNVRKHQNQHTINDMKYKGTANAVLCTLCNVTFGSIKSLVKHNELYH